MLVDLGAFWSFAGLAGGSCGFLLGFFVKLDNLLETCYNGIVLTTFTSGDSQPIIRVGVAPFLFQAAHPQSCS